MQHALPLITKPLGHVGCGPAESLDAILRRGRQEARQQWRCWPPPPRAGTTGGAAVANRPHTLEGAGDWECQGGAHGRGGSSVTSCGERRPRCVGGGGGDSAPGPSWRRPQARPRSWTAPPPPAAPTLRPRPPVGLTASLLARTDALGGRRERVHVGAVLVPAAATASTGRQPGQARKKETHVRLSPSYHQALRNRLPSGPTVVWLEGDTGHAGCGAHTFPHHLQRIIGGEWRHTVLRHNSDLSVQAEFPCRKQSSSTVRWPKMKKPCRGYVDARPA